jgi:hypothetical protein
MIKSLLNVSSLSLPLPNNQTLEIVMSNYNDLKSIIQSSPDMLDKDTNTGVVDGLIIHFNDLLKNSFNTVEPHLVTHQELQEVNDLITKTDSMIILLTKIAEVDEFYRHWPPTPGSGQSAYPPPKEYVINLSKWGYEIDQCMTNEFPTNLDDIWHGYKDQVEDWWSGFVDNTSKQLALQGFVEGVPGATLPRGPALSHGNNGSIYLFDLLMTAADQQFTQDSQITVNWYGYADQNGEWVEIPISLGSIDEKNILNEMHPTMISYYNLYNDDTPDGFIEAMTTLDSLGINPFEYKRNEWTPEYLRYMFGVRQHGSENNMHFHLYMDQVRLRLECAIKCAELRIAYIENRILMWRILFLILEIWRVVIKLYPHP